MVRVRGQRGGITEFSCWLNDSCFSATSHRRQTRRDGTSCNSPIVQLERIQVAKADSEMCNLENGDWDWDWGWLGRKDVRG